METPDKARQKTLNSAHNYERKVHAFMSDAMCRMTHFIAKKRSEIDAGENKFDLCNRVVKASTQRREETHAATHFMIGHYEKTNKKRE